MRAGSGVVLDISSVTNPSHSGSNGVTFTMMPQRAYVLLPTQIVSTSRGMRKYSTERASAKLFGGTIILSASTDTNERSSKFFGSMIALFTFVKILNSLDTRRSYPYDESPYEITPSRTCFSLNGSIILFLIACSRIHVSLLIDISLPRLRSDSRARPFPLDIASLRAYRKLRRAPHHAVRFQ